MPEFQRRILLVEDEESLILTLRDRARNRFARASYGILAMGWRGAASHWQKYETASLLLAGLATPLVITHAPGHMFITDLPDHALARDRERHPGLGAGQFHQLHGGWMRASRRPCSSNRRR